MPTSTFIRITCATNINDSDSQLHEASSNYLAIAYCAHLATRSRVESIKHGVPDRVFPHWVANSRVEYLQAVISCLVTVVFRQHRRQVLFSVSCCFISIIVLPFCLMLLFATSDRLICSFCFLLLFTILSVPFGKWREKQVNNEEGKKLRQHFW